jgi:hypothetical protein
MEEVINYIKAINGTIFGGYVRDKLANITSHRDIDCRIEKIQIQQLLNILIVGNHVVENIVGENYRRMDVLSYTIAPKRNPNQPFKLDVLCASEAKWAQYPCDFDVNMLVESNESIYIRQHIFSALWSIPNKINHILQRCRTKHFALISFPHDNFEDIWIFLLRAKDLVERGWTMDDTYLGSGSWIFGKWGKIQNSAQILRSHANENHINAMLSQNMCSICHEKFSDDDLVINTCCNHNFHWECNNTSPSHTQNPNTNEATGLGHWFKIKKCYQCPVCRQDAIKHLTLSINIPRLLSLTNERPGLNIV